MFEPVSNEARLALVIPNRDIYHTSIGKPKTRVLIVGMKSMGGFQVEICFQDEATPGSRAVPYGCLLRYAWGPEKITDHAALTQTQLMTHSPWVISLPLKPKGNFSPGLPAGSRTGRNLAIRESFSL
jgi:hypothetical protein